MLQPIWAQNKTITGTVLDDKGQPIPGASILVTGSKTGTSANPDGTFSLSVPSSATSLQISSVGYTTQTVNISNTSTVSVSLVPQAGSLNEVVVTGYGTARKKDVTGAVAAVSAKDFNQGVVTNPIQQIQGKVAGLVITQPGGDPNQSAIIRLRGQTSLTGGQSPLIVLDGVPLDDPNAFQNIPPGDIASYDILKDASATAIYGARGANGVIIVNTKKGQAGQAKVEYSGLVGVSKQANRLDLLNASEWKAAVSDPGSYDKGANTDWQDEITRIAVSHQHNLAVSGGAKGFNYRGSISYLNQEGVVLNSGKEQYGLRFNASQKALNDKLEITGGIIYTETNRKFTDYNVFMWAANTVPTYPVYNSDGSYFEYSDFALANPVQHQLEEVKRGKEYVTLMYGTVNYQLTKELQLGTTGSMTHRNSQYNNFTPTFPIEGNRNSASRNEYNNDLRIGNIHLNYNQDFGKHNVQATGVYEYNYFTDNNFGASGQQFIVEENQENNLGGGNSQYNSIGSYKEEYKLISFLARVNYNFASKYYVTASIRRDGSSKFGVNNRWGNFPSFDVAWRISEENFMKGVGWVSELKLRAGYGVTGNSDAISPYSTLLLYGPGGRYYNAASQTYPQTYSPTQNANPDLKWEERRGKNIGLDFGLFNGRLSGDINVFNDKTVNLLYYYTVPTPPFFINTILANVGDLSNKGVEISIGGDIVRGKKFTWNANGQLTFIKTRVESLSGSYQGYKVSTDQIPGGYAAGRGLSAYPITFLKPGYAPYEFYLPHFTGIDKDGHQLFDSAGVKSLTQDQNPNPTKYYIDPSPKFTYGLTNTFTYGNWSLNFFLRGVYGQKAFNNTALNLATITRLPGNNVTKAALTNGIKDAPAVSDLWLEKASYLRLDNATISYSFQNIKGISALRVYISGNNLFVITPYKGLDPEIQTAPTDAGPAYIDVSYGGQGYYPKVRTVSFGASVSF
ncbi:MAG: SusC/RagA family TonB-linked outer membrane protein [Ilyomonas sp.]